MEEIEVPLEKVQEDIHHHAEHGSGVSFMSRGALLSALLAVLAAISALMSGHYANDAMLEQIHASDSWAYYQAKGIKASLAELKSDDAKVADYKKQQEEIKQEAEKKQHESEHHLKVHEILSGAVTLFQVAIALTAIAVLTRRKHFVSIAAGLGAMGLVLMLVAMAHLVL